jgi:hypothetical protein
MKVLIFTSPAHLVYNIDYEKLIQHLTCKDPTANLVRCTPGIGGIVSMWSLCKDLNNIGIESYVTSYSHPVFTAPLFQRSGYNFEDVTKVNTEWVVMYPASITTNPLKAKNVTRWLLHPHKLKTLNKYPLSDVFFSLHVRELCGIQITTDPIMKEHTQTVYPLNTHWFDYTIFYNHKKTRTKTAYLIRKGVIRKQIHPDGSIFFDPYSYDHITAALILNMCTHFYSYDQDTAWCNLASLCGCIVVVATDSNTAKNLSAEEWYKINVTRHYGIAYGVEDTQHAINTLPYVRQHLQDLKNRYLKTVEKYIEICKNVFII